MYNAPNTFWLMKIYVKKYFDVTWERMYVLTLVVGTHLRLRSECWYSEYSFSIL